MVHIVTRTLATRLVTIGDRLRQAKTKRLQVVKLDGKKRLVRASDRKLCLIGKNARELPQPVGSEGILTHLRLIYYVLGPIKHTRKT
jgi:hypothetical protein